MKIVVLSDVHYEKDQAKKVIEKHRKDANLFVFLGDGIDNFEDLTVFDSKIRTVAVKGNWDYDSNADVYELFDFCGKKIFCTHGNLYDVDLGLNRLKQTAKEKCADICLYGHTHTAHCENDDGLLVLNPGAITTKGEYCILDFGEDVTPYFVHI